MYKNSGLLRASVVAWIGALVFAPGALALSYTITNLGSLAPHTSWGYGVNNSGQVTGYTNTPTNISAFIYDGATMLALPSPLGGNSYAEGINDLGHVTGEAHALGYVHERAFVYDGASIQLIDTLGGRDNRGRDINNSGYVTGYSATAEFPDAIEENPHAFLYDGVNVIDLGTLGGSASRGWGINESGYVAGDSETASGAMHAFVYDGISMRDLGTLGGDWGQALDINDLGHTTGLSETADGDIHAFFHDGTRMMDLGTLDGDLRAFGHGINNHGQIVGVSSAGDYYSRAFLYDERLGGMVDLNDYIDKPSEWWLAHAMDISDTGYITGYGYTADGPRAFLLTPINELAPIPEPGTVALLLMGLAGLAARSRRNPG